MTEAQHQSVDIPSFEFAVWWGLAAGPLSWVLDHGASYATTQHACSTGHFYVLRLISVVCLVIALSGFALAFGVHRRLPNNTDEQGHLPRDRAFFLSLLGIVMSLSFAVIIISETVPQWVLSPCS